jgi:general secretion pathway protein L
MPDRLLLRLASDGGLTWLRQGSGVRLAAMSEAGVPSAALLAAPAEVVVLVPAEDVLLTEVRLGARNRAQLLQALPFAVEDQLLSPVEDLHFAASTGVGDQVGVAVVAKRRMREWLDRLDAVGIRPDVLVPESLALPIADGAATAIVEDARAVVRLAPWSAFACSLAELPGWLAQSNGAAPITLDVHDFRAAPPLLLAPVPAAYHERQRDPLAYLAEGLRQPPLNLLDGEFALRHRQARGARWWRIAAALAATVVVLAVANLGFDVLQLSRASARLDVLAQDTVRRAFPDIDAAQLSRMSPEQVMHSRLDRLRGGAEASGLLRVLAQIAPVLGSTTRIQTRGVEYRNGTLELALRAPDVTALDLVREQFAKVPGLKVEVTAANPGAEGVDGRIRIGGSSP